MGEKVINTKANCWQKHTPAATSKPLVNKKYLLKKYPGKGGWTYASIPEVPPNKRERFGWVKVKGTIDGYKIKNYRLLPLNNRKLFLPVKAAIRKKIGKKGGDYINVILYPDTDPTEIPEELLLCLLNEPEAHKTFLSYTDGQQKAFVDWINSAKKIETKAKRITITLSKLAKGEKLQATSNNR